MSLSLNESASASRTVIRSTTVRAAPRSSRPSSPRLTKPPSLPHSLHPQPQRAAERARLLFNAAAAAAGVSGGGAPMPTAIHLPSSASSVASGGGGDDGEELDANVQLQLLFQYYCRFGRTAKETEIETLDNAMWAKFCRDTPGLLDRRLSATELDLVFFKVKSKAARRIDYNQVRRSAHAVLIMRRTVRAAHLPPTPHPTSPRSGSTRSRRSRR